MLKNTLLDICNSSLIDSKAENLMNFDVKNISSFTDEIILATATSNRHAFSVSEKLVNCLKQNKIQIISVEGEADSGWILVDCGDVVVNIMKQEQRDFYDLEGLWGQESLYVSQD